MLKKAFIILLLTAAQRMVTAEQDQSNFEKEAAKTSTQRNASGDANSAPKTVKGIPTAGHSHRRTSGGKAEAPTEDF